MGCNNGAPEQASTETDSSVNDTLCDADFRTVPDSTAQADSAYYATYINAIKIPAGYTITNPRVNYFSIPINNIDTLIKWKEEGKILPSPDDDASAWVMLALKTQNKQQTIIPYFVCYTSLGNGKNGPLVYYDLGDSKKINTIPPATAEKNILEMQGYIKDLPKVKGGDTLFYPRGFQFPWKDLEGLACSLRGIVPNNTLNGVLVIKDRVVNATGKDTIQKEVDYYLHSFYARRFTKLSKKRPGDDGGEYFDFVNPCPNSCPN
jgi:hypothetical protein